MTLAYLTRVVRFQATHRYHRSGWNADRNRVAFGSSGSDHAHNYECLVTVRGTPDAETGMLVDLGALDRLLDEHIVRRFDGKRINDDPAFADGAAIPTGEMLCLDIWRRVSAKLPEGTSLVSVRVQEDPTLYSEYRGE